MDLKDGHGNTVHALKQNYVQLLYNYGQILLHFSSSESANVTEDSNPFEI